MFVMIVIVALCFVHVDTISQRIECIVMCNYRNIT